MANHVTGKLFFVCFLFLLGSLRFSGVSATSGSVSIENENVEEHDLGDRKSEIEKPSGLDQQSVLLQRLEEIVRNLSEIVSRLDSKLSEHPRISLDDEKREIEALKSDLSEKGKERIEHRKRKLERQTSVPEVSAGAEEEEEEENSEGKIVRDVEKSRAVSVTKYSPFWSERFQFVSAVKLDSRATCIEVLPFRDYEGLSKYVAVGDETGTIYIFLRNGDVHVQFQTPSSSPITAMVSYLSVHKNESFLVTGHENGEITTHRVWERSSGEDWSSLVMETLRRFGTKEEEKQESDPSPAAITLLEIHQAGRLRYVFATDSKGKIFVFRENGTLHGSASPKSKPLAFLKQRLLFLTETGAGSLDLRTMKVRESDCEGLNNSLARNYVFDVTERNKAYGITSEGDLIHVLLLGDIMNFKCRVRSKRRVAEMEAPLAFQAIKGYLVIASGSKVFVYNVSTQHYVRIGAPRILFSAGLDEIRASFLSYQAVADSEEDRRDSIPLIGSNRDKFVVVGLGGGYVGMYRSNLPVYKSEFNTVFWTSPVVFFVLFLFAAWHFFAKKKEALTSWGPDDPFTSTSTASATAGAPLAGTSSGERTDRAPERSSFMDSSSRNSDMMEMRGGGAGLRGPTRRYVSPPRYGGGGGGATSSFRPSQVVDQRGGGAAGDPNFRSASELKFRGTGLDSSGFPKRRESLYVNTQGVDDSN